MIGEQTEGEDIVRRACRHWSLAAAGLAALLAQPLGAQPASSGTAAAPEFIPGWSGFVDSLRDLEQKALQKLTPEQRRDPQYRQEIGRLLLESLASSTLGAIGADADHPQFLPSSNPTLNVYQPNADTLYKITKVDSQGVYRIRGVRGSASVAKIGQFTVKVTETGVIPGPARSPYLDINTLPVDSAGRYDVIVSASKPAGYDGPWWKLEPGVTSLMLRQVASDWRKDQDPSISIERLDRPVARARPAAADLQARLNELGLETSSRALMFIDHVETLRKEGFENKLKEFDVNSNLAGLTGQFYYEGAYRLKPDEALILEAKVPSRCSYYSTILTNDIYETTDWVNNHSSLNDAQSKVDSDGVLRIVISARDPGVANWLDTAGYPVGAVQGRWTDCSEQPIPKLTLVKLRDVLKRLPAGTPRVSPTEREQSIRERRTDFMLRRHW